MTFLRKEKEHGVSLALYIQPKASKNAVAGLHGEELKIALTAPPVEGRANKALIAFLAKLFEVSKSSVSIVSGLQSRHKRCLLEGVTVEIARQVLDKSMKGS